MEAIAQDEKRYVKWTKEWLLKTLSITDLIVEFEYYLTLNLI